MKRFLLAIVVMIGGGMVAPSIAHACSGPMVTMEDVAANAQLVFAGTVMSSPHAGAYELAVEEVFRGSLDPVVRIGPQEPSGIAQTCSQYMESGDRVVAALWDRSNLGLFSSAVWYLLPDGTVGTLSSEVPAATHEELLTILRLLPDTALAIPNLGGRPLVAIGTALLLLVSAVCARSLSRGR